MNISLGTSINMVFWRTPVWEQRVTSFELKSILTTTLHTFERPFTPVAWHFLALNPLDSSAVNWAKVDTTYGISSTKMMRKHTEFSAESEMRVNHQACHLPFLMGLGALHF